MAWNADATRMPYRMHSEYLNRLFLNDDLAEGKYKVDDRTITLSAIDIPMFVVGTERDHVAPWHSVHKIHLLTGAEIRSEEHTSELQSLMRISYAVFCLKKKKTLYTSNIPNLPTHVNKTSSLLPQARDSVTTSTLHEYPTTLTHCLLT